MVARQILVDEREEALEELEEIVSALEGAGVGDVREMARRAGSSAGMSMPPRPRFEDLAGSQLYFANLLLALARTVAEQQERIGQLEAKPAAKGSGTKSAKGSVKK